MQDYLAQTGAHKLYVKFFDVDWDGQRPVPLAEVEIDTAGLSSLDVVPCVFITNRCMAQLPADAVNDLAERILRKTFELAAQRPSMRIREFQADCDWTASTRERYFDLLRVLRQRLHERQISLSVTVRLHQYRYPDQAGVPPADKGLLMCYNTGDVEDPAETNSILRPEILESYLRHARPYPLHLDAALPVFRWGVLFRQGRMIRLLHALEAEHLNDTARFHALDDTPERIYPVHLESAERFHAPDNTCYEVVRSTFLQGHYLYAGDRLRLEAPTLQDLQQAAQMLRPLWKRNTSPSTLAFYHLDTLNMRHFSPQATAALAAQ